jgi:predicted transcriptional regulator
MATLGLKELLERQERLNQELLEVKNQILRIKESKAKLLLQHAIDDLKKSDKYLSHPIIIGDYEFWIEEICEGLQERVNELCY